MSSLQITGTLTNDPTSGKTPEVVVHNADGSETSVASAAPGASAPVNVTITGAQYLKLKNADSRGGHCLAHVTGSATYTPGASQSVVQKLDTALTTLSSASLSGTPSPSSFAVEMGGPNGQTGDTISVVTSA